MPNNNIELPQTIGLQGALLDDDSPQSVAINLINSQLELMQANQRLLTQQMGNLADAIQQGNSGNQAILNELVKDKANSEQAFQAAFEKLGQMLENRPHDPEVAEQMVEVETARARQNAHLKRMRFKQALKDMPKGEIHWYGDEPTTLQINGVRITIQPGINKGVPQTFVNHFQKTQEMKRAMSKKVKSMQDAQTYLSHERFRFEGKSQDEASEYTLDTDKFEVE